MKQIPRWRHQGDYAVLPRPSHEVVSTPRSLGFSEIYREHAATVARWAVRLGGPDVDCEDVVQDVFVTVNRRLAEFRGEAKVGTWLFRITERTVANHRRKERVRRFFARAFGSGQPIERGGLTPAELLERREESLALYRTLDRLSAKHRRVLILFELEGRSTDEIAELLAARPGTVRVWLHRARAEFFEARVKEQE